MSKRVCVMDIPGLSHEMLRFVPVKGALGKWIARHEIVALMPTWPAVTCSVQATLTTGTPPAQHGIIANGIATYRSADDRQLIDASNFASYRRDVSFWEQSNQLLNAPRFWREKMWKTAMLFFQNAMPGFVAPLKPAADIVITPKPEHGVDGKLTSLLWTEPRELQQNLFREIGVFPLMNYWGPVANIKSSQWIARAAGIVWREHRPDLQLLYIPHLDYDLQRFGPDSPQAVQAVRDLCDAVESLVNEVTADSELIVLSEYAMRPVSRAIQPNLLLADAGLLFTHSTEDGDLIDYQRSAAFALCDHQIAHIYLRDESRRDRTIDVLSHAGARVVERLNHRRAGDVAIESPADCWFDYRWWSELHAAPKFARDVDIHRKSGYDPRELFFDPTTRQITDDANLVKGSHGLVTAGEAVLIGNLPAKLGIGPVAMTDVARILEVMLG